MIITQTPLRISLLGGGTDLPAFYNREIGAVLSCTIDKYIYVIAKARYDDRLRAGYTRTELVDRVEDLEHDLVREAFRMAGISGGVEVSTLADIPTRGSGLGSSSAVSVGLLHALWVHLGRLPSRRDLAEWACELELTRLLRPIGKQDQYATAYGGLRYLEFAGDGVRVGDRLGDPDTLRRLSESLLLFYTGQTRPSSRVLTEQDDNTERNRETLRAMKSLADAARDAIESGDVDAIGPLMHEGWVRKRTLARGIANPDIDAMYEAALCAGATGGKLCGAGGGGFVLVYAPPANREAVRHALAGYSELEFVIEPSGTRVLANVTRGPAWQRRQPQVDEPTP
jgi:D-glycero-alpha-D-manno-heptose-7-phosphate kinase